jgi:putative Mn2+ efflux pump MntP
LVYLKKFPFWKLPYISFCILDFLGLWYIYSFKFVINKRNNNKIPL